MASPNKRPRSHLSSLAFTTVLPLTRSSTFTSTRTRPIQHPKYQTFTIFCTANRQNPSKAPPTHAPNPSNPSNPISTAPAQLPTTGLSLLLLNFVTVLWGTQHAVIKLAINETSPSALNLSRFLLAALISLPALPVPSRQTFKSYIQGAELGIYLFLGYALQSVSLLTTSASRSGFLLYLNVKLVPLFARFLYNRPIAPLTWASAALALFGTCLLTYDGSPPAIGDVWSVLAAAASAMFILRLEKAAQHPPKAINAISLTSVSIFCAMWSLITHAPTAPSDIANFLPNSATGIAAVLYLGIVTTALSNYLQTLGQKHVPAERAAVIFAMDPVYGAFFASALLGESLGARGISGAACIAIAAFLSNTNATDGIKGSLDGVAEWLGLGNAKVGDSKTRK